MTATETKPHSKPDYSEENIRLLLDNYNNLEEGKLPPQEASQERGMNVQKSKMQKAPFEKPKQLKADIDRAIQSLRPRDRLIVLGLHVLECDETDLAFWNRLEVKELWAYEESAIFYMSVYLNSLHHLT